MEHIAIYKPMRVSEVDELTGDKVNSSELAQVFAVASTIQEVSDAARVLPKDRYHTALCSAGIVSKVCNEGESLGRIIFKNHKLYISEL